MKSKAKLNPSDLPGGARKYQFEAIGTAWTIDIYQDVSDKDAATLFAAIKRRIKTFDKNYSRFREDSLISAVSRKAGTYILPTDAKPLFDLYQALYQATDGAMTPLVGQLLADAGYDATYSLLPGQLSEVPTWEDVLEYDFPRLTTKHPVLLDVGAAGKGYLVDIVSELIEHHSVAAYCVDAGGDMRYRGADHPLKVGLEHPNDPAQVIGVVGLGNQSLCGSSGNRRAWGEFHHIMDPRINKSPNHIQALWVTAETTLLADACATALFFVPASKLAKQYTFEYAILRPDYSLEHSRAFPATFFTS